MKTVNKVPGDYIAGFVDGEGCFSLQFRRDKKYGRKGSPVYFYWDVEFAIVLKGDDKEILKKIQQTFGCGRVLGPDRRGMVRLSEYNILDLAGKIVPFFKRHPLRAKKRHDFQLWKEAVGIFLKNQNRGKSQKLWDSRNLARLREIYQEMRPYKSNRKWRWSDAMS